MPKILLVEDDNNLREIFEMRLQAEGYKTVTAGDGEEALDIAVKEKPDLIIADIMMPKLSGFEMLETLRSSPNMANVKVVMMTALGQAEDRARGEKLGVVKYLVKSQVTLEDFVRVVREVLPPSQDAAGPMPSTTSPAPVEPQIINKQESEKSMQEDSAIPTSPAPSDSGAGTNPISGGGMPASDSGAGAMSTDEEKDQVDKQVGDAMGGGSSVPAGDSGAASMPGSGSMGGDTSTPSGSGSSDMPASGGDSSMPAAPAAEEPAADDSSTPASPPSGGSL